MIIEKLVTNVLKDEYFIGLNDKISKLFAENFFAEDIKQELTKKEFLDLLRFADIFANSQTLIARNKAYKIITLLNDNYKTNPFYQTVSHSVLAKLGNFPGIQFLRTENNNNSELPFEYEIEKGIKEFRQTVPHTNDLIFTDSQFELYNKISNSKCFSFSGPTSMGKSFVIKSFIRKIMGNKPPENIVIMVPTRALINQFSIDFNKELKESLEYYKYAVVTNSNVSELSEFEKRNYIFVLTPERLLSFLFKKDNPPFAYLFVDEAHKLAADKDSRSITAYTAISNSLRQNPNLNLYFSSPNVSNPETFLKLFKKDEKMVFSTKETPVFQNLFFVDFTNKKVTHYLDNEHYSFEPNLVKKSKNIADIIFSLGNGNSNIIYCSSKLEILSKCVNFYTNSQNVQYIASKDVKKAIRLVKEYIHKDYYLAEFLEKGIAYHFGNLPQIIRNKIEALFKVREINYIFCTSTLLEGVNLPAKNVFILNNKNGRNNFQPIDFWNLAGRAGRLKYELSGNIICLKENDNCWKKSENLLENKKEIILNASIENFIDKKLKKIEQILSENINLETGTIKEILEYIANIINIDTLEIERTNYRSEIINKLIQEHKTEIIELAKKNSQKIEIPSAILNSNYSIKLKIQNSVFLLLKKYSNQPDKIKLPSKITYEICREKLEMFYKIFHWDTEETKKIRSNEQLNYYATLMNQWMNGISLNQIINESINYHIRERRKIKTGYNPNGPNLEVFDNNSKHHINIVIGNVIEDIENVLRFTFEKYFNNYYLMLVEILGEENAGVNWAAFLEYGTQDSIMIALQNIGLSRHSSNYLLKKHKDCLKIEQDKFIGIDMEKLKKNIDKESIEYDEICSVL